MAENIKKYTRRGPVFQDRFESRILFTDEYNFAVSAYIHNNPHDIEGYSGKEETYKYSSYGIYLGLRKNFHQLVDLGFMMDLFHLSEMNDFAARYCEFVSHQRDVGSLGELKKKLSSAVVNEYVSGRSIILRELSPSNVIKYIAGRMMISGNGSLATSSICFRLM